MRIKVEDLEPNPYRKIEKYPIDKAKVEALKVSIASTSFWDNILVRPHPEREGRYQIAYGHHRLLAVRELGIKEIDIPVRRLDEVTMVKIMAEENLDWSTSPGVINETVLAAKDFLDDELAKYKDWKHADKNIRVLFGSNSQYQQNKEQGVGRDTILKFLGSNWKQWKIQAALETFKEDRMLAEKGGISRKAIETLPTMHQARVFRNVIKKRAKSNQPIDKQTQQTIAKKIRDIGSRGMETAIEEIMPSLPEKRQKGPKILPMLDDAVREANRKMSKLYSELSPISRNMDCIQSIMLKDAFAANVRDLTKLLNKITKELESENVKRKKIV